MASPETLKVRDGSRVSPRIVTGVYPRTVDPALSSNIPSTLGVGSPGANASSIGWFVALPPQSSARAPEEGRSGRQSSIPGQLGLAPGSPVAAVIGSTGDAEGMMTQASLLSRVAWTTTGLFVAWLNLDGRSRGLAGGFAPGITVGSRFDQRSSSTAEGGQWVASVAPRLTIGRTGPVSSWEISGLRSYDSFSSSPVPRPTTDLASVRASGAPTEGSRFTLDGGYLRSQDLFYLAPGTTLTPGQREISSGSVGVLASVAEATDQIRASNYEAADLADGLSQEWIAAVSPLRADHSLLFVRWRQRDWWLDRSRALGVRVATAGYRAEHSPVLSSELEIGLADTRDTQHGTQSRDFAVSAGISGLGRALGLPFDARARIVRDVATTGAAQLWRSVANAWVAARWERTLDAEGGLFHDPTLRDLVAFEVRDTLGGGTVAMLSGSYARTRPRVGDGLRVENSNASASLSRHLRPWLTARATYRYSRQIETRGAAPHISQRSRAELSLTAVSR